ncbi:MAG TPA: alpha-L-rhamnosidase C-terminal domain-containing protein, partial [Saprospiraceae bacterium]|nr:alpha-L-rhamnosidase C-terminal domain-containing protein [Saprospiraceae bacterium]
YVLTYKNDQTSLIHNLAGGKGPYEYGIIDWPANMRYGYDMSTSARTVINAYAYSNFVILGKVAAVVGNTQDQLYFQKESLAIKKAFNQYLLDSSGLYIDGLDSLNARSKHHSQHANAIAYALDVTPQKQKKNVITFIKDKKMSLGMITLRWLPEALGKANEGQHMVDLYTNITWDGWARTIDLGGTVTWESWKANETNESMSHPWGAVGLLGIQNYILGIKPLAPQNHLVSISPLWFGDRLTAASGTYTTDSGNIAIEWSVKNLHYTLKVNIPTNIKAQVSLPYQCSRVISLNGKKVKGKKKDNVIDLGELGSGQHTIISKIDKNKI